MDSELKIAPNVRLTFDEYGCFLALVGKSRSVDPHTRIGGVAFNDEKRILGIAYNGLGPGVELPEWMKLEENRVAKSDVMIHCESNLCSSIIRGQCDTICLTQSPCIRCCQNIVALNVKRVVYIKEYPKCDKFKDFLSFHGIEYIKLSNESKDRIMDYIMDINNFEELLYKDGEE